MKCMKSTPNNPPKVKKGLNILGLFSLFTSHKDLSGLPLTKYSQSVADAQTGKCLTSVLPLMIQRTGERREMQLRTSSKHNECTKEEHHYSTLI